jgi:uncharacterized protein
MAPDLDTSEPQQLPSGPRGVDQVRAFLKDVSTAFQTKPFKVHPVFRSGHAQTLGAHVWPRRRRLSPTVMEDEERLFQVDAGVQVLAQCRWQKMRQQHPTIVIWHGMEGSTSSVYMWSIADKGFRAGFNVVRVNYRNCGGTEHLTPTLYHGGLSDDLGIVIDELITKDRLKRIFPIGFSLGGNMVLKLAGEFGEKVPSEVVAICAVSPSVDLRASTNLILRNSNWIYHKSFVRSLKQRIQLKHQLYPKLYDVTNLDQIRTIRDFDERFTSVANGFANADDYYHRSSCIRVVDKIRIPTLIIHAIDDPFIPIDPIRQKIFAENPYLLTIATERGGHVAFIAATDKKEDRFWAENRAVEFCQLAESRLPIFESA